MDIGMAPSYFTRHIEGEESVSLTSAIDLVLRHGFSALLLSCLMPCERAEAIGQYVTDKGAYVHQTHLPYYRYTRDVDYGEVEKKLLECAEVSRIMGAQILVAHIDEFDFKAEEYTPSRAIAFNRRLFDPVVDFAAKHNMRVAFENVFLDMGMPRFGSDTEELLAFTDSFQTDTVGICWDFGHAKMQYPDTYVSEFDKAAEKMICTHLHDNYYGKDLHAIPFLGNTDFGALMKIYHQKAPTVPLCLELVYGTLPQALHEEYAALLSKTCRLLADWK